MNSSVQLCHRSVHQGPSQPGHQNQTMSSAHQPLYETESLPHGPAKVNTAAPFDRTDDVKNANGITVHIYLLLVIFFLLAWELWSSGSVTSRVKKVSTQSICCTTYFWPHCTVSARHSVRWWSVGRLGDHFGTEKCHVSMMLAVSSIEALHSS